MDLRELETFRAVVEAGGMARAAARLHRAQSSVTARIHHLEAALGVTLFDRDGRNLRLTAAGDVLLDYAGRMLDLADEARAAVRRDGIGGRLRLGSMESVAASRLPMPLAEFHRAHPQVAVELQTGPSRELAARLQAGELEAAIIGDELDIERFASEPLYEEELVLVGAHDCVLIKDLRRLSAGTLLVFHGNGCAYRRRLEGWLQSQRIVPARVLEFASYHAILAAAAAGVGVSLVPRSVVDIYAQRDAVSIREVPARVAQLRAVLAFQRDRHTPVLTRLLEYLRADAAEVAAAAVRVPARTRRA